MLRTKAEHDAVTGWLHGELKSITAMRHPAKTFRAAEDAALDPARVHGALASAAALLDPDTPRYAEPTRWVNSPASGLDERFGAGWLSHRLIELIIGQWTEMSEVLDKILVYVGRGDDKGVDPGGPT